MNNIVIKADLQTTTETISLVGKNKEESQLQPDTTIDQVIHHEVKELGMHMYIESFDCFVFSYENTLSEMQIIHFFRLVCEVIYTSSQSNLPQSFRKYFKFQVAKPLDIQTKFFNAEVRIFIQLFNWSLKWVD